MNFKHVLFIGTLSGLLVACGNSKTNPDADGDGLSQNDSTENKEFEYLAEKFGDIKVIRYKIPSWDKLSLQQKKYAYYLTQAGYAGREIIYDQNYRHNLAIKRTLEKIYEGYKGDKSSEEWTNFSTYVKQFWAHNGLHHHYSNDKLTPKFTQEFLTKQITETGAPKLNDEALKAIFDPAFDNKKVNKADGVDIIKASAVNMYAPELTQQEVEAYYKSITKPGDQPISYGLNSKLVKNEKGQVVEQVYKVGGMYGKAIEKVIYWLQKAIEVAENEEQAHALQLLIEYYKTGSLQIWDEYNIAWAKTTSGDIDYINSFIEVYNDPIGYTGSFENIVEIKDFEMTEIMSVLAENVQWFEDNSSIMKEHKKAKVTGVSYKVVDVAGEAGDASPFTPIGVNLPNSNWIREQHGSKSVSLGNIIAAYDEAGGSGILKEFALAEEEVERVQKHNESADKMHTALHEVVGHASGKMNPGITTDLLKNYASTLEEARADLVGLYYIMDQKLVDLGLIESLEVGKVGYDDYIRNGLMTQLVRLDLGKDIEEDHMRNRQLIAAWAFEKGAKDKVIEKVMKNEKTYFKINDYTKLRELFGQLLKEIQRIKSEGDFKAGKNLVETYGVKVDQKLHKEVLDRVKPLNIAPYGIFINPKIVPVEKNGEIIDFKIVYQNFDEQMLEYAKNHAYLPDYN